MYPYETPKDNAVTALADSEKKGIEWEKQAVPAGTTIDAEFLWPDEMDPEFTAVYRDGQLIDDKMITITAGSVYHSGASLAIRHFIQKFIPETYGNRKNHPEKPEYGTVCCHRPFVMILSRMDGHGMRKAGRKKEPFWIKRIRVSI